MPPHCRPPEGTIGVGEYLLYCRYSSVAPDEGSELGAVDYAALGQASPLRVL